MDTQDIIRAWKDKHFRKSLSRDQQALLPEHPAGEIVLSETELARVNGGVLTDACPDPSNPPMCTRGIANTTCMFH